MSFDLISSYCHDLWYAVQCQPGREHVAARVLKRLFNIDVYFPKYRTLSGGKMQCVPYFPGYIFAQVNFQVVSVSQIQAVPGVIRFVRFGGTFLPLSSACLAEMAQKLEQCNALACSHLAPGDVVRGKRNSPFQELEMVVLETVGSQRRVRVLLTLLGRQKQSFIGTDTIEKVPVDPVHRQRRYTRGRGRKIHYPPHI